MINVSETKVKFLDIPEDGSIDDIKDEIEDFIDDKHVISVSSNQNKVLILYEEEENYRYKPLNMRDDES